MGKQTKGIEVIKEKQKENKVKLVNVAIVLDRSGSMARIKGDIIGSFNNQIKTIKKNAKKIKTRISLFTFSTMVDPPVLLNKKAKKVEDLTEKNYVPDGFTSMLDGVGTAVASLEKLESYNDPETSFLVIVVSDGLENHSREYTWESLAAKIEPLEKTGRWNFVYIGSDQDLGKIRKDLKMSKGSMMAFTASAEGVSGATLETQSAINSYYSQKELRGASAELKGGFFGENKENLDKDEKDS